MSSLNQVIFFIHLLYSSSLFSSTALYLAQPEEWIVAENGTYFAMQRNSSRNNTLYSAKDQVVLIRRRTK
jgi:hypothetical protein